MGVARAFLSAAARVSAGGGVQGAFTNLEFYEWAAPHNPALPYVYDDFDWDHCERQGFDFAPPFFNRTQAAASGELCGEFCSHSPS